MSALEIRELRNTAAKMIKSEERGKLLRELIKSGIGVREIEEFVMNEESKLRTKSKSNIKKGRDIVVELMKIKMRDNVREGNKLRKAKNKLRKKVEDRLGKNSRRCRWVMRSVRTNGEILREKLMKKNVKKFEFLKGKYVKKNNPIDELMSKDKKLYGNARIFKDSFEDRRGINTQ